MAHVGALRRVELARFSPVQKSKRSNITHILTGRDCLEVHTYCGRHFLFTRELTSDHDHHSRLCLSCLGAKDKCDTGAKRPKRRDK